MKFLSLFSGIEAASCAWLPLGWECVGHAEIEPFPCAVLKHHYPNVPNFGDVTKFKEWPDANFDVLIGGSPCQSFSVAGLRKGLDDPRGNLMLTYLAIVKRYQPRWVVWENVPGVLSSGGGRDFGTFLGGLGDIGYGFAYRVLDAQYFGVAQRRRRVFVVGHLGDWRRTAAVLFERESLSGNPPPRREAGKGTARGVEIGPAGGGFTDLNPTLDARAKDGPIRNQLAGCVAMPHAPISPAIKARDGKGVSSDGDGDGDGAILVPMVIQNATRGKDQNGLGITEGPMYTLDKGSQHAVAVFDPNQITSKTNRSRPTPELSHTLPGTGNSPAVFNIFGGNKRKDKPEGGFYVEETETTKTLDSQSGLNPTANQGGTAVAFAQNTRDEVRGMAVVGALAAEPGMKQTSYVRQFMQVRRLTPRECERLQGFPDDYTLTPFRNKPAADGPRYKALGNSMAVPVISWIGKRIAMVEVL